MKVLPPSQKKKKIIMARFYSKLFKNKKIYLVNFYKIKTLVVYPLKK